MSDESGGAWPTLEYDDKLPNLPEGHFWLVVRENFDGHPKVYLSIMREGFGRQSVTGFRGRIDVELYGDGCAVVELAEGIFERFKASAAADGSTGGEER